MHWAATNISASKQEHTTTRYFIKVFHGGRANFSFSMSDSRVRKDNDVREAWRHTAILHDFVRYLFKGPVLII